MTLTFKKGGTSKPFDYVIVATSVAIWPFIQVDGNEFPYKGIANGPAIKYLAPVEQRFWIPESLAPSGMSDTLGMTWEGTDNQANTAGFDLSVFAGGKAAQDAINNQGSDSYYAPLVSQLYPGFSTSGGRFHSHPNNPAILTGYSCPGPRQVVGAQQSYSSHIRIIVRRSVSSSLASTRRPRGSDTWKGRLSLASSQHAYGTGCGRPSAARMGRDKSVVATCART